MFLERFRLDGKGALITGGAGGIGLMSAIAFAEAGATVAIADRREDALERARSELEQRGHRVATYTLDVTQPDAVKALADELNARAPVDILFANAGIAQRETGGEEMSDVDWRTMIDVNLNSVFWCCRSFGAHMLERGRGSIITTGSMSGLISNKPQRQAHYNAAKAGVHHLTKSLAGEWAPRGVRVNSIAPGYVDTAMSGTGLRTPALNEIWMANTPMARPGQPDEIASVALFLASEASSYLAGSVIVADGGYTVW